MPDALIMSVGGSERPLIISILKHRPAFVSFMASQATHDVVAVVKAAAKSEGCEFTSRITLLDDENSLMHCHEQAEKAVRYVLDAGYAGDAVYADYTGGTKNMSVALSLAAIEHGFTFSYIGGSERSKDGVGTVIDGCEDVYECNNPWDFLAVEERKKIAVLFNNCQFKAAGKIAVELKEKTTKYKLMFEKLVFVIEAFYLWDLFRHKEAEDRFKRARLSELDDISGGLLKSFAVDVQSLVNYIAVSRPKAFEADMFYMLDIYANAERRFSEGKTDDAIVRLYRFVEMSAQERLWRHHSINVSAVRLDQLPISLQDSYSLKYGGSKNGTLQLAMQSAFVLLKELGDELGERFCKESRFKDIQSARNNSYLAHGFDSSKEKTYEELRDFILSLNIIKVSEVRVFPELIL